MALQKVRGRDAAPLRLFCLVLTSDNAGIVDLNYSKECKALILEINATHNK